ncbi:MAG: 30S ribosomal protein S20 [Candidatus Neomarinimicrobiota bacterium]
MDRHQQQIKRERQDAKRHIINKSRFADLRTAVKNVLNSTDAKEAQVLYKHAVKTIDKMTSSNLLHRNTGARRKARISRHLNSLSD